MISSDDNAVRSTSDWFAVRRSHDTLAARFTGSLVNNETTPKETSVIPRSRVYPAMKETNLLSSLHARGAYPGILCFLIPQL